MRASVSSDIYIYAGLQAEFPNLMGSADGDGSRGGGKRLWGAIHG